MLILFCNVFPYRINHSFSQIVPENLVIRLQIRKKLFESFKPKFFNLKKTTAAMNNMLQLFLPIHRKFLSIPLPNTLSNEYDLLNKLRGWRFFYLEYFSHTVMNQSNMSILKLNVF